MSPYFNNPHAFVSPVTPPSKKAMSNINTNIHRHPYSNPSPSVGMSPAEMGSPLPALIPHNDDDEGDDYSPASTHSALVTPKHQQDSSMPSPIMSSDHSMLSSMSQMPTPKLSSQHDSPSRGFPLLPPHHPLRSKLYSTGDSSLLSPPHTPKGHPIDPKPYSYFGKSKSHAITNPYGRGNPSYTTSLAYLLRIPRRLRPVLLVGVCILTFGLVMLSRAMSEADQLDLLIKERKSLAFSRRFVQVDGLMDINSKDQQQVIGIGSEADTRARQAEALVQQHPDVPQLVLENHEEELAALISFVTSTTANALPPIDPSVPLEPSVVLDFDPAHPNARDDLEILMREVHALYPIILFGKMRDPWHREIKKMLSEFKIAPAPLVIDVDQRRDHETFIPLISRLLGTSELPQLLLHGKSVGSYHEVSSLRDAGTLKATLEASGHVQVSEIKKKKKGVKERERIENERILGPAPIQESE